jgi:hypothetical protein
MKSSLSLLGEQEVRWQAESERLGHLVEKGKLRSITVRGRKYDFQTAFRNAQSNQSATTLPSESYGPLRTMLKDASADLLNVTGSQDEVWRLRDIAERGDVYMSGIVQINFNRPFSS